MNIFFFGDSICFGQYVSQHKTWVVKVSKELQNYFKRDDLIVMNTSISGNTTRMALERMTYDVLSHGIDIILIEFGINDCNLWETNKGLPRVSPRSFEANLLEMIELSKKFGSKKILVNTNHPTSKILNLSCKTIPHQLGNKKYNDIIRKLPKYQGDIDIIDIEKEFENQISQGINLTDLLLDDGIHLSEKGHELYFSIIFPHIVNAIKNI